MAEIKVKLSEEDMDGIANKVYQKIQESKGEEIVRTYTVKEVASVTNATNQTVLKHIRLGLLKARKTGKSYTITENNLKKYLENEE